MATNPLVEAGMRAQIAHFRAHLKAGMPRVGWKAGAGGLVAPLNGHRKLASGGTHRIGAGVRQMAEAETAIRVGSGVVGVPTLDVARKSIAAVSPAIELIDFNKPRQPLDQLLEHNILRDASVFGAEIPYAGMPSIADRSPRAFKNGEFVQGVVPGRVPDDLAEVVVMIATTLAPFGESVLAGDWIICGSYIEPFEIVRGDLVEVDAGWLGRVSVTLA
ncbi:MAG: hypothetical protein ABI782_08205 [Anaerolineaceae bacterium]